MGNKLLSWLHQPEYTGDNRCWACTAVNLTIASVVSLLAAQKSRRDSAIVFAVSTVLIYFRGYLVPGTPALTKRYLPAEVLKWFGKDSSTRSPTGLGAINSENVQGFSVASNADVNVNTDGETRPKTSDKNAEETSYDEITERDPEVVLLESGILVPCEEQDDLCLADDFQEDWRTAIENMDDKSLSAADAVEVFGLDDADIYSIKNFNNGTVLEMRGQQVGQWPSEAALLADIAAAQVIEKRIPNWGQVEPQSKGQLLNALRLFLETCPTGDGPVTLDTETVESCCQSYAVVTTRCAENGERLFEHQVNQL